MADHALMPAGRRTPPTGHRARRAGPGPLTAVAAGLALALVGCASSAAGPAVPDQLNAPFLAQDLDVDAMVARFEGESREVAVHRDAIAATLGLRPGQAVADVGAGTGLFLEPLARAVGPTGTVWAVDIAPGFVEHMRERARTAGFDEVRPVLCTERSVELPDACADVVFVCDTYHHFAYPDETLASIHRALRPGGRLVIVDFIRDPGSSREWILEHVRCGEEQVVREVEAAGFTLVDRPTPPGLRETYVLRFRRDG